jgi:hypothetical protein
MEGTHWIILELLLDQFFEDADGFGFLNFDSKYLIRVTTKNKAVAVSETRSIPVVVTVRVTGDKISHA